MMFAHSALRIDVSLALSLASVNAFAQSMTDIGYSSNNAAMQAEMEASSVRGPKHVVKGGKTPELTADEARSLIDAIDTDTLKMIKRRALAAGLHAEICNHTLRGTGITEYLRNGGEL